MRRILIVDGHSVIHQWPELLALHARRMALARESLVRTLTEYQDISGVQVVAVFDGQGARPSEASEAGGIQVFYSGAAKTADDVIERLTAKYATGNDLTVATSDLAEQQTVSSFGGYCVSAAGLRDLIERARGDFSRESGRYRRSD